MSNNFIGLILVVALTAPIYALINKHIRIYFLLLLSIGFYAYFSVGFVLILGLVILTTHCFSFWLYNPKVSSFLIWAAVFSVSLPLLFYKYLLIWFNHWFFEVLPVSTLSFGGMGNVLIPVGLSFYTFQCLGYLIDLSKMRYPPEHNFFRLAAFVSFFPQILAGPIERYPDLSKQLFKAERPHGAMIIDGLTFLLYGVFLKLAIAERLSDYVQTIFVNYHSASGLSIFFGFISFTLQIFADFGGYSFMALGIASLYGIRLTNNFQQPFCAVSIVDFWQRWHVSLTRWVGDYVYRPLALKLLSKSYVRPRAAEYAALLVTWLTIGMWHGALLNFAVFGIVQFLLILVTGHFRRRLKKPPMKFSRFCGFAFTMFCVIISFALIRAPDFQSYLGMIVRLFSLEGDHVLPGGKLELFIGLTILLFVEWLFDRNSPLLRWRDRVKDSVSVRSGILATLVILIAYLGYDEISAFIYFQY